MQTQRADAPEFVFPLATEKLPPHNSLPFYCSHQSKEAPF